VSSYRHGTRSGGSVKACWGRAGASGRRGRRAREEAPGAEGLQRLGLSVTLVLGRTAGVDAQGHRCLWDLSDLDFRLHDLRRTAASLMTSTGTPRVVVQTILNHVETGVTAVYESTSPTTITVSCSPRRLQGRRAGCHILTTLAIAPRVSAEDIFTMNVSLTPELERLISDKVDSGLYQTASEVVREALRLLKERDQEREALRADVRAGFDQLARGKGTVHNKTSGRRLAEGIKAGGRQARTRSR
jgi:antitoxin ParD1/3/4